MNNLTSSILETGVLETAVVLKTYGDEEVMDEAAMFIPVFYEDIEVRISEIKNALMALKKKKLLILTPEIAFLDYINKDDFEEIIICLPSDCSEETYKAIEDNMPSHINVVLMSENERFRDFTPSNGVIVAFGSSEGNRAMILNVNYRMMENFKSFYGNKILASCGSNMSGLRPVGWAPINTYDFFNEVI